MSTAARTENESPLSPECQTWWLCGTAEPKLKKSIVDGAVILVNDTLLVKFVGKLTGLCIRTMTTDEGKIFLEENWYSPADKKSRETLKQAFDTGMSRVAINQGIWLPMRALIPDGDKSPAAILNEAKRFADILPDRFPETIQGMTRQQYRERNHAQR